MTATRTNTDVKEELLTVAKEMLDCGLVHGTAGNFSARLESSHSARAAIAVSLLLLCLAPTPPEGRKPRLFAPRFRAAP